MATIDRRGFLGLCASSLLSCAGAERRRHRWLPLAPVTLVPRVANPRRERVAFTMPFPPGLLDDASRLQVLTASGQELPAAVQVLEPWRGPPDAPAGRRGLGIRAVLLQVECAVSATSRLLLVLGEPRPAAPRAPAPPDEEIPRVGARLPAAWLCRSEVSGPQVPRGEGGAFAAYDALVERSFPASLRYLDSRVYHHWLFDRTSTYYKQYVRSGDERVLDAARHCARFLQRYSAAQGPDAGHFTLKGPDLKYVYPQAMHLHYLLSGDAWAQRTGEFMARYCLTRWDPVYRPERYQRPDLEQDPEHGRPFWSPRHQAYGLLGVVHGYELTGEAIYYHKAQAYLDALAAHQAQPPDGLPADGSFRQDWALLDPGESSLAGATSPWMSAILLDALFQAFRLTGDPRVPGMVTRLCDFLDRRGFAPDGTRVYYLVDCLGDRHLDDAPGPQEQGPERHSLELAHSFAMGAYFSRDAAQRARFLRRCQALFTRAQHLDFNAPVRCYNWAFHASAQLLHFARAR